MPIEILAIFLAIPSGRPHATHRPSSSPLPGPTATPAIINAGLSADFWLWIVAGLGLMFAIAAFVVVVYWGRRNVVTQPSPNDKNLEGLRIIYGFWLIVAGLLMTLAVAILALTALKPVDKISTADVVAVITSVTGVIGTLIAAFFGIQAAGAGRSQAMSALGQLQAQNAGNQGTFDMNPSYGPREGNTLISITGNGLSNATCVNFGSTPGTNLEIVNDGLLHITSPAAPQNLYDADVTVVFPPSTSNAAVGKFHYYNVEPPHGPAAGGTAVTITGAGFGGASGAYFGTVLGGGFAVGDDHTITVNSPPGNAASDVAITIAYPVASPTNRATVGTFHYD